MKGRERFLRLKRKKSILEEIQIMAKKYCYLFTEGNAKMREILGGKGANLAEMTRLLWRARALKPPF